MSGGYYEDDPNAEWNAQFETDPAAAAYQLAQTAIAQHEYENQRGFDEQRVAVQAAALLADAQAQYADAQAGQQVAQTIDRSMAAAYGEKYVELAPQVGSRLAADPVFQQMNHSDANAVLQHVDGVYQQVAQKSDPSTAEWARIKAAGARPYHQGFSTISDAGIGRP